MSVEKKPRAPRSGSSAPVADTASTEVETPETLPTPSDSRSEDAYSAAGDSLSPADAFPDFAVDPAEVARRTQMLKDYVRQHMIDGEDYGIIPGSNSSKPTLFKSGAEKLNAVFGLSPLVEVTNREENWDDGFVSYEVKVTLFNKRSEKVDAEGLGSCNSRERRYKNQDAANIANTVLKMAKKRALVDATLSATRASGMFTQDLEDMDLSEPAPRYGAPTRQPSRDAQPEPVREGGAGGGDLATEAQHRAIMAIAGRVFGRHSRDEDVLRLAKKPLEALSKAEASGLIDKLRAMLGEPAAPAGDREPAFNRAGRNGSGDAH